MFGESTISRTQVQFWYNRFKEGREDVNDVLGARAHPQPMKTLKQWRKLFLDNRRIAIREVADGVGISFGSCQAIFTDVLGMKSAAAKIVTKFLNFKQKQRRMCIAQEMLTKFNDDPDLLKKVITSDESWLFGYDIETKAQLSQGKHFATIE